MFVRNARFDIFLSDFAATLAIRNGSKESCPVCLRIEILDDVQQFGLDVPGHAHHLNSTLRRPQHECAPALPDWHVYEWIGEYVAQYDGS